MLEIDGHRRKWWLLAAMGGVLGLTLLDETVVGVALPSIREDLGISQVRSHWVVNAYVLVLAGLVTAGGKLGDLFGLHRLFIAGIAVFGLASLCAGFAPDGTWLIGARSVQGIGAAVIFPASTAMITVVFPPEQRGTALGIYAAIGTIFVALGPLVGGFVTDTLSWRWIFWVNLPVVAAVGVVASAAWVDPVGQHKPARFDVLGLATLVLGLSALVFAIMEGPEQGWHRPLIWAMLVGGIVLLITFTQVERRASAPIVELDLFRNPTFTANNLSFFAAQFNKMAVFVFVAMYLQDVLHMSPLGAGLASLVAVVPAPLSALVVGRLADRFGQRVLTLTGLALTGAAEIWLGLAVAYDSYALIVAPLLMWGAALPLLFSPAQRAIMNAVPADKQGQAAGIGRGTQALGGALGMALCSSLLVMTGDFGIVFLLTGGLTLAVLALGWFMIKAPTPLPV